MTEKERLIEELENYEPYAAHFPHLTIDGGLVLDVLQFLREQPEQKHGYRMLFRHPNLGLVYRCSVCKLCVYDKYKFCPHCGAKMNEEVKQDEEASHDCSGS